MSLGHEYLFYLVFADFVSGPHRAVFLASRELSTQLSA